MILLAVLGGFILDLCFADPSWIVHPVVIMGKAITAIENLLRTWLPKTQKGELWAGRILAVCLPLGTMVTCYGLCYWVYHLHPIAGLLLQTFWCWQALAIKGLADESRNVYNKLRENDLSAARIAISRIVGRDTAELSEQGVIKAAVETVAENFSDGVIAPLFYMLLGGAPLALVYKSINTMDSMVGYKNDRYINFGRAAAKLDDVANYIPSRLAALLMIAAAYLLGFDGNNAWKIWRRDNRKHASPNSAQTESACAGALRIQLAGPAYYFGKLYDKPYIGDALETVEKDDILKANKLLYAASIIGLFIGLVLRLTVMIIGR